MFSAGRCGIQQQTQGTVIAVAVTVAVVAAVAVAAAGQLVRPVLSAASNHSVCDKDKSPFDRACSDEALHTDG